MKPQTANDKLYDHFISEREERRWPLPDADIAKQFEGISKSDVYNYRRAMHIPGVDIRRENIWTDSERKRQDLELQLAAELKRHHRDNIANLFASLLLFSLFVLALIF